MKTDEKIVRMMNKITDLLLAKNKSYGDSATKPRNIFAKGSAIENISARIDDKLARIENAGVVPEVYDTIDDLIGYLCLLKIALEDEDEDKDLTFANLNEKILSSSKTLTGALSPDAGPRN